MQCGALCVSDGVVSILTQLCDVALMTQFEQSHKTLMRSDVLLFTAGISPFKNVHVEKIFTLSASGGDDTFIGVFVDLQASAYLLDLTSIRGCPFFCQWSLTHMPSSVLSAMQVHSSR